MDKKLSPNDSPPAAYPTAAWNVAIESAPGTRNTIPA
jgi:hypothetical protein